jgi:transposase
LWFSRRFGDGRSGEWQLSIVNMTHSTLLPCLKTIMVESVTTAQEAIVLRLSTVADVAACPLCSQNSQRIHSHYSRTLTDLPWNRVTVRVHLHTRKFFCDNPYCVRRVFTEPVPELAARYARKTLRLSEALQQLVYMVGGEAGARIAQMLGLLVSPDSLLETVKKAPVHQDPPATPRVLGIDDFAFRKGYRYGTLLVDLERGPPVDMLPDREPATVEKWLVEHPGIEIISRDRSLGYASAIRQAAPQAVAVADRFHIMKNLMEALEKQVAREYPTIRQLLAPQSPAPSPPVDTEPTRWQERRQKQSRERRLTCWQQVHELDAQGYTQQQIAEKVGISARTVRSHLRSPTFPERRAYPCPAGKMDIHHAYLARRWQEGCQNALQLWRELKQQGFSVSATLVRDYVRDWRVAAAPPALIRRTVPSIRSLSWLLLPRQGRTPEQEAMRQTLLEAVPVLHQSQQRVQEFRRLLKGGTVEPLTSWIETVTSSDLADLAAFARGLEADRQAVEAAVTQPWSNGPTEGQVNRLKFIKRQGYGRAGFALLKARTLPLAA